MSEGQIQIDVEFSGAQEAVSALGQVEQGVREVGAASASGGQSFEQLTRRGQELTQRVQGVASAVQTLTSAIGSRDRTAGMVASVAGATAQFAGMGAMLGPGGTVLGAVVGFTSSIITLSQESDRLREATLNASHSLEALGRASITSISEAREEWRLMTGEADAASYSLEQVDDRIAGVNIRLNELIGVRASAIIDRDADAYRRASEEIGYLNTGLENLNRLRGEVVANASRRVADIPTGVDMPTDPNFLRTPGRGGGGGPSPAEEAWDRYNAAMEDAETRRAAAEEAAREAAAEHNAAILEEETKRYEAERALADEAAEEERKRMEESLELHRELAEKQADIDQEMAAKRQQVAEQAMEQRRQTSQEMTGMLGDMTMSFGKSIAAIATGEKTADEAFKGMLKSFLEMISQYATLKAATEFADAGAAFARYDYSGGAQHLAAGVAFTAVAVATGVGAGALGAAPSAPARPESSGVSESSGKGGDVIINWNSPVVTAGTKAELGREIGVMLGEAAAL